MSNGYAQDHVPPADPFAFDPDFQWFRPVTDMDLADMKPKKRANTGWFATYDRLVLYGSRPELNSGDSAKSRIDSGWGHRYEIGYMLPDVEHGWMFTATNNEVSAFNTTVRERLNRYNVDDYPPYGEKEGNVAPPFGQIVPAEEGNNIGYFQRLYFVQDSLNVMDHHAYEINKSWRMEPYHYGGILEPFVGFRWGRLEDLNQQQTYTSTGDGTIVVDPAEVGYNEALGEDYERLITDYTVTENEVLAGQVGFRYIKFRDRFTYTADVRAFTGGSLQSAMSQRIIDTTTYDGEDAESAVTKIILDKSSKVYTRNEEFVIGFDIRGELAYQLTKAIKVRGGFQVIDYATGIWRGGPSAQFNPLTGGSTDQDYVMVGGTFGIELNR